MTEIIRAIANGLDALGENQDSMRRDRPYNGQPWTDDGKRGETLVEGLTMRDVRDCLVRAFFLSTGAEGFPGAQAFYNEADKGEAAMLSRANLYEIQLENLSPVAVAQNLTCEIERMMGIFPNIDPLRDVFEDIHMLNIEIKPDE